MITEKRHTSIWRTIRFRFALWTAGLLLVVLTGFSTFVYLNMAQSLKASIDDTLQLSAAQAVAAIEVDNGRLDLPDSFIEQPENADLRTNGLTLRLLSPDGSVIATFGSAGDLPVPDYALDAAHDLRSAFATLSQPGQPGTRLYTTPIDNNNTLVGIIQVSQSMRRVQETLHRLLATLLVSIPFLIIIAGLGGYGLASRALAPIDAITRTANRISGEDLSMRLNLPATNDEVGRLAATFDRMLARLDEAFRRERRFTADASHELRTPLAAMQAILDVIREKRRTADEYEQALDDLSAEAARLRALAESLLLLARGDGQSIAHYEWVNLSTLLVDVIESLHLVAAGKHLDMTCTVPDGLVIWGEMDSLIRLFVNLVDNAIKYTEKGHIEISAQVQPDAMVKVDIADTGVGIPAQDLPHIFERFYRVEKSRTSQGAGLGLAIVQEIVQAHAGKIDIVSTPEEGTTVSVWLPLDHNVFINRRI